MILAWREEVEVAVNDEKVLVRVIVHRGRVRRHPVHDEVNLIEGQVVIMDIPMYPAVYSDGRFYPEGAPRHRVI